MHGSMTARRTQHCDGATTSLHSRIVCCSVNAFGHTSDHNHALFRQGSGQRASTSQAFVAGFSGAHNCNASAAGQQAGLATDKQGLG